MAKFKVVGNTAEFFFGGICHLNGSTFDVSEEDAKRLRGLDCLEEVKVAAPKAAFEPKINTQGTGRGR